jgi:hypothetical protein
MATEMFVTKIRSRLEWKDALLEIQRTDIKRTKVLNTTLMYVKRHSQGHVTDVAGT